MREREQWTLVRQDDKKSFARNANVPPKIRDVLQQLKDAGWQQVGQTGSHRQFKHPTLPGRVTVAGKPGDDVAPGTLGSILKQAGIKR